MAKAASCEGRLGLPEGGTASASGGGDRKTALNLHQALEETMKAAIGVVSPLEQFVQARNTIAEMKKINTKDSTGDILQTTQVRRPQRAQNGRVRFSRIRLGASVEQQKTNEAKYETCASLAAVSRRE